MSTNPDQFFEEEEELARKDARSAAAAPKGGSAKKTAGAKGAAASVPGQASKRQGASAGGVAAPSGFKPPSFAMVVAIALVALVLGICIGYFFAMSVVGSGSSWDVSVTSQQQVVASSESTGTSSSAVLASDEGSAEMPEGHPDISSMMNEDGTINQEAVDAYKAQLAAAQANAGEEDGDGDDGQEDATPSGDEGSK